MHIAYSVVTLYFGSGVGKLEGGGGGGGGGG